MGLAAGAQGLDYCAYRRDSAYKQSENSLSYRQAQTLLYLNRFAVPVKVSLFVYPKHIHLTDRHFRDSCRPMGFIRLFTNINFLKSHNRPPCINALIKLEA